MSGGVPFLSLETHLVFTWAFLCNLLASRHGLQETNQEIFNRLLRDSLSHFLVRPLVSPSARLSVVIKGFYCVFYITE